jgi:hypothetical protein
MRRLMRPKISVEAQMPHRPNLEPHALPNPSNPSLRFRTIKKKAERSGMSLPIPKHPRDFKVISQGYLGCVAAT